MDGTRTPDERTLGLRLDRRGFLGMSAVLAASGLLAACKRVDEPTGVTGPTGSTASRPPLEQEPGTLEIYDWTGYGDGSYGDQVLWKPYKKEFPDLPPNFTTGYDDDKGYAKAAAGQTWDITHPCAYRFPDWVDLDVLQPWDTSLLTTWPQLNPALQARGNFDGQQYFLLADWGYAAPMYRSSLVEPQQPSWDILWDERYEGKITWWDSVNMLVVAGLYNGVPDVWNMTDEELAQMRDFLIERRPLVRTMWLDEPELIQLMKTEEVWIGYAWTSAWNWSKGKHPDLVYMDPQEGRTSWACGFALFQDRPNYYHAHKYVDAWLSPESGLWLLQNYAYGHSNTAVDLSQLDPEMVETFSLDDPSALEEPRSHPETYIPRRDVYSQFWSEVKAA
ncbi:MAG TPA: extracellular solute-binding protein [Actinomycetota bacterium]|nr:extracellular solute-binding protein [Actinomycetota bacterium]